jgi:arylsulfatase
MSARMQYVAINDDQETRQKQRNRAATAGDLMRGLLVVAIFLIAACTDDSRAPTQESAASERPNILLIVVDDMAFSDLGSFGGEIRTPNLDHLAREGIRLTNFHTGPMCSPSRAMLLTGVDSHPAGFGNMLEELSPNQKGQPGYDGYLHERVVTITELLRDAGYQNYLSGKWHLGSGDIAGPPARGFARSFTLDTGGASHFSDMRPAYAPSPDIKANYWEDGVKLTELPPEFEYSSQFYVDKMMNYLGQHDSEQPFFAYLSFTAPHWPIQAPDDAIARHAGKYDDGYDLLAAERLGRAKEMGLLPPNAQRSERSPKELPFLDLDEEQRKIEIRAMEVYAAMIDEVDVHTGRLLEFMTTRGLLDNTVIIFLSDNGAEGHDLDETWPMEAFPDIRKTIDTVHDFSYENIGRMGSYTLLGPNWANAGAPSFKLHKGFPTEGGTHVAAFVHYPTLISRPAISNDFVFIKDLAPTVLELAGVDHPGAEYDGRSVTEMSGRSFVSLLQGKDPGEDARVTGIELMGKRAIRSGDWKLVHMPRPYGIDDWQLFNLKDDISETRDLSGEFPDKVTELKAHWDEYAERNNVIIPDWVSGY